MQKIAQKMVNVMKKCGYIQKQGKNAFHNYKYAMASDVLEKVHDALTENGLVTISIPEIVDFREVQTSSGKSERLVTVKTTVKIIDSESGETIETVGLGSGQDAGDKAVMKAETASQKYAWMMALLIATGDDPEADEDLDRRTDIQPEQSKNAPQPTQNVTNPPTKANISEAQRKRFNRIVEAQKAEPNIVVLLLKSLIPELMENGKIKWDDMQPKDYNMICNLFEKGEWKTSYEAIMNKPEPEQMPDAIDLSTLDFTKLGEG